MKPVAPTSPRGRIPELLRPRLTPLAHHQALAQRCLANANGDQKSALRALSSAFEVHPRRATLERSALRRAHRRAIEEASGAVPLTEATYEDDPEAQDESF